MTACEQDQDVPSWSCSQAVRTYNIAVCTVLDSWWWTDNLSETCTVLFQKNKYEKLVHLVAFIIRIYHDARSPERQILYLFFVGDNRSLKCHISRYTFVGQAPILDGIPHVINRNLQHWVCFTGGPAAISARKLSKYFSSPASSPTLLTRNKPYFLEEHF